MRRTKEAAAAIDTRDWAEGLPPELLGCILDHVTAQGYARFAAVCASWRSAVKEAVNSRRPPPPQLPWVYIWPAPYETDISFPLLRPYDGKYHDFRPKLPPDFQWQRLAGVSPGCVVLVGKYGLSELLAFNLLTGAWLRLPGVRTIPEVYPKKCVKVAMSSPGLGGAGPDAFMALLQDGLQQTSAVAVARAGDKKWSLLDTTVLPIIYDVAYHEGAFYVLGEMRPDDLREEEQVCIAVVPCGGAGHHLSSPLEIMVHDGHKQGWGFNRFLVWSASGDLLLVVSSMFGMFAVYRLDLVPDGQGGRKIEMSAQLRDLGDHALVVGPEGSMAVSTLQMPQLKRNHVYFICDHDLTMCSLEDGSMEHGDDPYLRMYLFVAARFFPSLI